MTILLHPFETAELKSQIQDFIDSVAIFSKMPF